MSLRRLARTSILAAALAAGATAQSQLEWLHAYDGTYGQTDYGRQCAVDGAGDVYVCGRSYNPTVGVPPMPPSADFELAKYSPSGVFLWSARKDAFGGEDNALDCQLSPTGDVYVSGYGWNGNDIDLVVLKFTSAGAFDWLRSWSGAGGGSDMAEDLPVRTTRPS